MSKRLPTSATKRLGKRPDQQGLTSWLNLVKGPRLIFAESVKDVGFLHMRQSPNDWGGGDRQALI
jgi:hypothetical protein